MSDETITPTTTTSTKLRPPTAVTSGLAVAGVAFWALLGLIGALWVAGPHQLVVIAMLAVLFAGSIGSIATAVIQALR